MARAAESNLERIRMTFQLCRRLLFVFSWFVLGGTSVQAAIPYEFYFLDGGWSAQAYGVNNDGQIVGSLLTDYYPTGAIWQATVLKSTGGDRFAAINNLGQVVGEIRYPEQCYSGGCAILQQGQPRGVTAIITDPSSPGKITTLGSTENGAYSTAYAVNNSGQTVGVSMTSGGSLHATLWNGVVTTDLETIGSTSSEAHGINDAGQIVGVASDNHGISRAVLWSATNATYLTTQSNAYSKAFAINSSGQIAGESEVGGQADVSGIHIPGSGLIHATLWDGAVATDLGTLGGYVSSANGINSFGQVVGSAQTSDGSFRATLWSGSTAIDLNSFLDASAKASGLVLVSATGINDNGWIVGSAVNVTTGYGSAFLLAPVTEPETYAMMLAGLGLVGGVARSRMCKS